MSDSIHASATAEPQSAKPVVGLAGWWHGGIRAARSLSPGAAVGVSLTAVIFLVALLADVIAPGDPFAPTGAALTAPSSLHFLGTDDLGRDLFTGVVHGLRTSVIVAASVALIALPLGVLLGSVAGILGGWVDDAIMRFTEIWQVLPRFFLALMVIALFGPGLDRIVVVLGLTSWALLARIARAETLSIREREFVESARALGASHSDVLRHHIIPHVLPAAVVYVALLLAQVSLIEASLGFLGLSDPNAISLGYLASQAQAFLRVAWWMWLFPGVALITLVIGFNLVADSLTDRLHIGDREP
ncbi:MAG: ABC transporter permease [Chloroflexi bacterium]|nr:ABC transporter permease [Chloroflexota bacterium]